MANASGRSHAIRPVSSRRRLAAWRAYKLPSELPMRMRLSDRSDDWRAAAASTSAAKRSPNCAIPSRVRPTLVLADKTTATSNELAGAVVELLERFLQGVQARRVAVQPVLQNHHVRSLRRLSHGRAHCAKCHAICASWPASRIGTRRLLPSWSAGGEQEAALAEAIRSRG